jgi:hypothetical protein
VDSKNYIHLTSLLNVHDVVGSHLRKWVMKVPLEVSLLPISTVFQKDGKMGNVPGRDYMREKANHTPTRRLDSANEYETGSRNGTKYVHGQPIMRDITTNIHLPLLLPLCRVLLLDSSSPVIEKWEKDRGKKNFTRTDWTFPPATRELERHASEHQLIASGSMMGAHRTTSFDRLRKGSLIHLAELKL